MTETKRKQGQRIRTTFHAIQTATQEEIVRLPLEQAKVMNAIMEPGANYESVATLLQWPVGTVKSRLNRARAKIAAMREAAKQQAAE